MASTSNVRGLGGEGGVRGSGAGEIEEDCVRAVDGMKGHDVERVPMREWGLRGV